MGLIILLVLVVLDIIPAIISCILSFDNTYHPKRNFTRSLKDFLVAGSCAAVHFCAYMLMHKLLLGHWNFIYTCQRIQSFDYSYQDVDYWPVSLAVRLVFALVWGLVVRFVLALVQKGRYKCAPLSKKRGASILMLLCAAAIAIIGTLNYGLTGMRVIQINEVCGNNTDTALDDEETVCDYIELYNTGALRCTVYKLYLSDDSEHLQKMEIPATTIPAKGYLLIKLDDGQISINKDGAETLTLSNESGKILDQVTTTAMEPNYSLSRIPDGCSNWKSSTATPGTSNREGTPRLEAFPVFSHESGFYEKEFDLQILADADVTVYYTLDGSVPTTDSLVYKQPIQVYNRSSEPNLWSNQQRVKTDWKNYTPSSTPVDKAFIIRAIAVAPDGAVSKEVTACYFVDLEKYAQGAVVSLVADPGELWGTDGIYVTGKHYDEWYLGDMEDAAPEPNYNLRGRDWERPAYMCYLSQELSFSQNIGIRVSGGSSRSRPLKPFSLYARKEYSGNNVFDASIFSGIESKRLSIRGGYANSICQMLVPDRNFGIQRNQRVAVFLNGEFWYNANILEKYDDQYFYEYYGVNPSNLIIAEKGVIKDEQEGDQDLLDEIYTYLYSHDMAGEDAYAGFGEIVDLQSYIDYMCFNIYIDNMDYTEIKNSIWWRSREKSFNLYEDGKWRFLLYDLDAMEWGDAGLWGVEKQAQKNSFSLIPRYTGNQAINQQPIYVALKKNPKFAQQFALTFMDMVNTNFQYENVVAVLDAYGSNIENYLSGNGGTRTRSYYEEFFKERASYIVPFMAEEFSLSGTLETLTLRQDDASAGTLLLNTIQPDMSGGAWSGQYYTDYPVTVTAVPAEGYRFVRWEGAVNSDTPEVQVTIKKGGVQLNAVFEKITNP